MSDRLKQLNKIFLLGFFMQASACSFLEPVPNTNTEIICANGSVILVKYIRAKDLGAAIKASYVNKKKQRTSEGYTPVRLKDGRSFVLKNLPPEVASTCDLRESKIGEVEASYVHHF